MVDTLLRLLERMGAELPSSAEEDAEEGRSLSPSLLFPIQDKAYHASEEALRLLHAASAAAAQQRTALDAATDHLRLLDSRGRDVRAASMRVRDALERVRLIALNTGLEGLRSGDPVGKALVALAEELRSLVHRGVEALDEHAGAAEQLESERDRLQETLVRAHGHGASLADELLRAQGAQQETRKALDELGTVLQSSSSADREIAKQMGAAATHAKQLAESLDSLLGTPEGRSLASETLAPTLEALGAVSAALRSERGRKP